MHIAYLNPFLVVEIIYYKVNNSRSTSIDNTTQNVSARNYETGKIFYKQRILNQKKFPVLCVKL